MDDQPTILLLLIFISIALAVYGIVCGRWLTRKLLKLADEVKGDRSRGMKALAMWPISIIALIVIPTWVARQSDRFHLGPDRRKVVLLISLVPSCIYNLYY